MKVYFDLVDTLLQCIDELEIDLELKEALKTWEKFQSEQKGPVGPIYPDAGRRMVEEPFLTTSLNEEYIKNSEVLAKYIHALYEHGKIGVSPRNVHDIDFTEHWKTLKPNTARGYPYNAIGSKVDDEIMRDGGKTFSSALKFFKLMPQNFVFTGVRLQGTPRLEEAKVRMINNPTVNYQYMVLPLVHVISDYLKQYNNFAGWNVPETKVKMIMNAIRIADQHNCTHISLDFSKFDRSCNATIRGYAYDVLLYFFGDTDEMREGRVKMDEYSYNQYLMFVRDGQIMPTQANNLLLSGVADTQLVGCIINLAIQMHICEQLGSPILLDAMLALGDDVAIPISNDLIDKGGYKGVLSKISEIVQPLGFVTHDVKAYPRPDLNFLQKGYFRSGDKMIIEQGSYARVISSFMYKENYAQRIPGIKSIKALELFSQITLMSDVEVYEIYLTNFRRIFAEGGLNNDDGLRAVLAVSYNTADSIASNADRMVRLIIQLTTNDIDNIAGRLKSHSYDSFKVQSKIGASDYSKEFNISTVLVEVGSQRNDWNYRSIRDVFGVDLKTDGDESNSGHVDGEVEYE